MAEKIRTLVRCQKIDHQGSDLNHIVTVSLGVAAMVPQSLNSPDELVELADRALYQAKARGRDRVEIAPPAPQRP